MDIDDFVDVGNNIKLGNAGVITATSFVGDGSDLTNLPAGLGTALSATASSPLNKMYYTNQVLGVPSSVTVDVPASASKAYTQYADIKVESSADLIIAEGDDLIPDVLGLADFGTFGGGATAGRIRVNSISNAANDGSPTVQKGLVVTGVTTSTTFSGSGASLTNLNASNIASGTVPTARLGSGTANSSTFLRGDSTFATVTSTTINNNADNRVITGSGTANTLNAESVLTFDGTVLTSDQIRYSGGGNKYNGHPRSVVIGYSGSNYANLGMGWVPTSTNDQYTSANTDYQSRLQLYDGLQIYGSGASVTSGQTVTWKQCADFKPSAIKLYSDGNERLRINSDGSYYFLGDSSNNTRLRLLSDGAITGGSGANDVSLEFASGQSNNLASEGAQIRYDNSNGKLHISTTYNSSDADIRFYTRTGALDSESNLRMNIMGDGYIMTPSQPSFRATKSGSSFNTGGGIVVWDQNQHNIGSNYNTSNGRFTAPVTGTYIFTYYSIYTGNSNNDLWDFRKNGSTFAGSRMHFTSGSVGGSWDNVVNTQIINLSANDYVEVYASDQGLHGGDWSHFCGHLLG